jgi:hypothetical protein
LWDIITNAKRIAKGDQVEGLSGGRRTVSRQVGNLVLGRVLVIALIKQEVGGELFVLVAGKVGLNSLVLGKAKAAKLPRN